MGATILSSCTCLSFVCFWKFSAVLFLFLRHYLCYDNTSLRAFITVDCNLVLNIWECYSCRALVFTGYILHSCSETLVLRTTGQRDVSFRNTLNFVNAWLLVISFRSCIRKVLCNYELIADPGEWCKAWVGGLSLARIMGSNPAGDMNVSWECCVLLGRGVCEGLITRPEGS
jgi:hypothetical protein